MADVLKLSDGTNTVDFISATTSDYKLAPDGISMPVPDVRRVVGGDPLLREGERLIERQYGNREVGITFHIEAADHDALLEDIRAIVRLLDIAKQTAREGFGAKVTLAYNLTNATDQMIFDVLDGELDVGNIAGELVRRQSKLLRAELTLLCQPYARLAAPIEIMNELVNPGFDHNPGEQGRDATNSVDCTAAGDLFVVTVGGGSLMYPTGNPPIMACGAWINKDVSPSADEVVLHCGQTTFAWELGVNSSNKPYFEWEDSAGLHRVTGATSVTVDNSAYQFIGATLFTVDGTEVYAVLMLGDQTSITVDGFLRIAAPSTMIVPTTFFGLGAQADDTEHLGGLIAGAFVLIDKQILPYQLAYIYKHGIRSLFSDDVMTDSYWGLAKENIAAVWPFDESSGNLLDKSGNAKDLIIQATPTFATVIAKPGGWTLGTTMATTTTSGLTKANTRHGHHAFLLKEPGPDVFEYIEQSVETSRQSGKVTCIFWARGNTAGELDFRIRLGVGEAFQVVSTTLNVWKQFIMTDTVSFTSDLLRIIGPVSGAVDITIDSIVYTQGHPFGVRGGATPTDVTDELLPFIGSRYLSAYPTTNKVNYVEIEDVPGDAPATTKVKIKNSFANPLAPIRVGMSSGGNPNKREYNWRASEFAPIKVNDADYASGADPVIDSESSVTAVDRFQASLASLFPFPKDQVGAHRFFVAVQSEQDLYSFFRMVNESVSLPLSGDPVKDINSVGSNIHVVDGGIVNWPPEVALSDVRSGNLTARPRQDGLFTGPKLTIANIADNANTGLAYEYIFAVPVDGGFFSLMASVANALAGLQNGEELVIDTIDEESVGYGYIQEFVVIRSAAGGTLGGKDLVSGGSGDLALFGTGFLLQPRRGNVLVIQANEHALANDILFGRFTAAATLEVILEYMPRFLYV